MFSPKHCRLWPRGEYHTIHLALNLGIIWCGWKNKVILIKALSKAILPGFLAFCCTDKHVSTWIKLRYSEGCKPHDRTVLLYHCTWNYLLHMMPRLQCMCHYDSAFTGTVQLGLKLILRLLLSLSRFPKLLWMTSSVQSAQHLVTCRNGNRIWVKSNGTITLSQLFTTRDCFFFLAAAATRSYVPHSYCNVKTMSVFLNDLFFFMVLTAVTRWDQGHFFIINWFDISHDIWVRLCRHPKMHVHTYFQLYFTPRALLFPACPLHWEKVISIDCFSRHHLIWYIFTCKYRPLPAAPTFVP